MNLNQCSDALVAWASTAKFQALIDRAEDTIKRTLMVCEHPYVAFSCGKDSSVLSDIVLGVDRNVPLRFLSSGETRIVHNVDTIISYFRGKGADVQEINIDRVFSDEWIDKSWTEQRKAGKGDLATLSGGGYDAVFMGLRKEESRAREISLRRCYSEDLPPYTYRYKNKGMVRCCPLANWTTVDIAAYLARENIPVLAWYEEEGIESRTTARLTGDAVRQNVLVYVKLHNPAGFQRLVARFPEFKDFM